ncbi:MAG: ABC transporter permease [Clostridia bacterium]
MIKKENAIVANIRETLGKAGPLIALIVLSIFLSIVSPTFLSVSNLMNISRQAACNGLIALGMMLSILTAGIDLSVGSVMALSSIVMGKFVVEFGGNAYLGIIIGLGSGALLGLVNGLLLTKMKLPHPFISTLGTQNIFRGICLILTMATPISGMPVAVSWAGSSFIADIIPVSLVLMILAYIAFSVFLNHTVLGRHIYAVGGNVTTARLSGINVDFTLNAVYTISGLMCGFAGIVLAGRVDAVYPLAGISWETDAIAAVIIGGASFFGGKGNVLGTFSGVILIAVLRNGLNLLNITADAQTVILGTVIILAVFIDVVRNGGFASIKKKKSETQDQGVAQSQA